LTSLKAEIAAMQGAYLIAEAKLKDSITRKQRGTENHRDAIRAIFKNNCDYLRQLVCAGLLPPQFSIGHKASGYRFIAHITGGNVPMMTHKEPKAKAEKQPLTESQREEKRALKTLKQSYEWCRKEMDESLKNANPHDRSYRLFVQYSRDLDADYLAIRQELAILPKNLALAESKGLHFVCVHGENDSLYCTLVDTQEELEHCYALNKAFIAKRACMSAEDEALRAKFDAEFNDGFKI
jgi:hypothetical protein